MDNKRIGRHTVCLTNRPAITASYSVVGDKEGKGPLGDCFDEVLSDPYDGQKSWELAESSMMARAIQGAVSKGGLKNDDIDYLFAGDLLNQCSSAHFAMRDLPIPFFGVFGACSTMAESLSLAAMAVDAGYSRRSVAATSSHFCSAEKQFRFPLEYGGQRPLTAQSTVTGAGAAVISATGTGPRVHCITTGKVIDKGVKDANNMGAAMAPAAADSIYYHFAETGKKPADYDLIVTGDLGSVGKKMLVDLLYDQGYDITGNYEDCGCMIYDPETDQNAGASGCGCSAVVLGSKLLGDLNGGKISNLLFVATGALMNATTSQQGMSIPCIAHAISIKSEGSR